MKTFYAKAGNVTIPVYPTREKGRPRWEIRYSLEGKTIREKRSSRKAAELRADQLATALANDELWRLKITRDQAHQWRQAEELLHPTGKPILQVVYEELDRWKTGLQLLHGAGPLVPVVVEDFLQARGAEGLSKYYLRDFKTRLHIFARDFQQPINHLKGQDIQDWLTHLRAQKSRKKNKPARLEPISPRTWNNYRAALVALFAWCQERKLLPADWDQLNAVSIIKIENRRIPIFTPDEMSLLVSQAGTRILPAIVLGGFAGIRTEEIQAMHWGLVKWEKAHIFLPYEITKTRKARIIPMHENLIEWLRPWRDTSGPVCDYANLSVGKNNLAHRLGLKWKRNALRHSYISYRVAQLQDVAKVALECGNSPAMIHKHYLELVTPADAEKWFAIRPQSVPQNLLNLKFS